MGRKVARKDNESESKEFGIFSEDLPSHITTNILLRLPIKELFICKSVCKGLNSMISNPAFAKLHFKSTKPTGFMLRTNDPDRLSRFVHLLDDEPEKFRDDEFCFCRDRFIDPECDNHVVFDTKFKLPVHGPKLILDNRDETLNEGTQTLYTAYDPEKSKFDVVNSCKGFLCLCDRNSEYFVVCNPVVGEFIRLPKTTRNYRTTTHTLDAIYTGFGFHAKTNEFKVVRMLNKRRDLVPSEIKMTVEIHILGTSTWRNVGDFDVNIWELGFPTCLKEALHWICLDDNKRSISRFHFESERFDSLPLPEGLDITGLTSYVTMGVMKGRLYICDSSFSDVPVELWIMRKYGDEESWTKVFRVNTMFRNCWPYGGLYWPVLKFRNPAAILLYHSSNCFIYYEFMRSRFKCFKVHGSGSNFEGIHHIPSLISLKEIVKGGNIKVMDINSRHVIATSTISFFPLTVEALSETFSAFTTRDVWTSPHIAYASCNKARELCLSDELQLMNCGSLSVSEYEENSTTFVISWLLLVHLMQMMTKSTGFFMVVAPFMQFFSWISLIRSSKFKLVEEDEDLFLGKGGVWNSREKRIYPS